MWLFRKKAQSTAEYVVVLGLVVGAIIAMQTYVKRSIQSRIQQATDYTSKPTGVTLNLTFTGCKYEPDYMSSNFTSNLDLDETKENIQAGGSVDRDTEYRSNRTGNQIIDAP